MATVRGLLRCVRPAFRQTLQAKQVWSVTPPQLCILRSISISSSKFADRYFAESHEYISVEGDIGTVGISNHAQETLGDIVFVQLPDVDAEVAQGGECGAVESVKAASDLYSPVSGTVTEVNGKLDEEPSLINNSCYTDGWVFKIKMSHPEQLQGLMDEEAYNKFLETET